MQALEKGEPLLNRSWGANAPYLAAVECLRKCLYWLSFHGAEALRAQVKAGRVLVEVDRPIPGESAPRMHGGEDYRAVELCGCQVIWRKEKQNAS
ncbi:hypothetical protein [Microbulbifer sp. PSTR4-B]|uniref:hypothetical protein n=1 Tax=unclassified Microbulbifer TaxID=2619833 RepID=UPI00403A97A7